MHVLKFMAIVNICETEIKIPTRREPHRWFITAFTSLLSVQDWPEVISICCILPQSVTALLMRSYTVWLSSVTLCVLFIASEGKKSQHAL